jgi:hypothetical protein
MGSVTSPVSVRHHVSDLWRPGFAWSSSYTLTPGQPSPGFTYPPASPHCFPRLRGSVRRSSSEEDSPLATQVRNGRAHSGTGISTGCASTTPFGLALAPDSPWVEKPSPGTLGLSAEGFLTPLSLLMPAFSLDRAPRPFTLTLHCTIDAPLPSLRTRGFGIRLEPRYIIRARSLDQ